MSNYLSQEYKISAPQSPIDTAQVAKTVGALQNKYDVNSAMISQVISSYNTKLKGLRESDNAYIASKLKEVTSVIDQYKVKNGNLAYKSNVDSIMTAVTSVLEDPIVADAVASTQNYSDLDTQYQTSAKKDPNLANRDNYQDALDQGGFSDYMQGKTKKLGKMEYVNYTDVQKTLNDKVSKWAKDNGYHTMINSVNKGMYFENTKGTYLTKDEVLKFIDVNVDPVLAKQMDINARQSFGKMSDQAFAEVAKKRFETDISKNKVTLAEEQAKSKTASGASAEIVAQNIAFLQNDTAEKQKKLDSNAFDRKSQYEFYRKDLYNGLADAYDKAEITDIDYDTTPLDVAKFGFEQQKFATETALKQEELQLKKYELDSKNSKGQLLGAGTAIPVTPEEGEKEKPAEDLLKEDFVRTDAELRATLQKEDPLYRQQKTLEDRNNYINQLMKAGGTVNPNSNSPLTTNTANAIISHKNNYKVYGEYVNGIKRNIEPLIADQYNDMAKAKNLNLSNLSRTMPFTSQLLKSKKSFDNLNPQTQDIVRYERVINQLQFDSNLSEGERKAMTTYLAQVKKRNLSNSVFQKAIEGLGKSEEIGGVAQNFVSNYLYGTIGKTLKNNLDDLGNAVEYGYDWAVGNDAEKNWKENQVVSNQDFGGVNANYSTYQKAVSDINPLVTDSNITEVDTGEDSGTGKDMAIALRDRLNPSLKSITESVNKYRPNIKEKQSFSFSTEDKAQAPIASLLGQVVQRQTGDTPNLTKNNYNLEYFAGNKTYKISYLDDDSKPQEAVINENLVPTAVRNMYGSSVGNWATDIKNKNATLPKFSLNKPSSHEEAWKMVDNMVKISGDGFNAAEQDRFRSTVFLTPEEKIKELSKTYPKLLDSPQAIQKITEILNSKVEIESQRMENVGFKIYPIITTKGKREALDTRGDELYQIIPEYDPSNYLRIQMMMTDATYNSKINEIIHDYKLYN